MFKSLLVLEGSWEQKISKSYSVWPFISEFTNQNGNFKAYHKVFSDKNSFESWVSAFNKETAIEKPKLLYIASHGSQGRVNQINRQTIINLLKSCKNISYVHFGSCDFGSENNLTQIMDEVKHLKWVAGYETEIDWLQSTLYDLLFWNSIMNSKNQVSDRVLIKRVRNLINETEGLSNSLKFNLFLRDEDNIIIPISSQQELA